MAGVILEPIMSGVGGAVPSAEYLPGVASICQRNRGCSCTSTRSLTGWAEPARCSDISIGMCPKTLLASPKEFRARICRSLQRWSKIISFSRSTASPGKPAGGAGNTYGGHPAAAAVALRNMEILLEENPVERPAEMDSI